MRDDLMNKVSRYAPVPQYLDRYFCADWELKENPRVFLGFDLYSHCYSCMGYRRMGYRSTGHKDQVIDFSASTAAVANSGALI